MAVGGGVVTAWNPDGRLLEAVDNKARHAALAEVTAALGERRDGFLDSCSVAQRWGGFQHNSASLVWIGSPLALLALGNGGWTPSREALKSITLEQNLTVFGVVRRLYEYSSVYWTVEHHGRLDRRILRVSQAVEPQARVSRCQPTTTHIHD